MFMCLQISVVEPKVYLLDLCIIKLELWGELVIQNELAVCILLSHVMCTIQGVTATANAWAWQGIQMSGSESSVYC